MTNKDESWKKTLLHPAATIQDAIKVLDEAAQQIVLVVSEDHVLVGTITDGDIRRALLRGHDMNSSVESVVHRDAFVVPPDMNREIVLNLMGVNKLRHVPVVDENQRVIGLHRIEDVIVSSERENLMVVMAGGVGTRLRPYTETCPKPLLPVAGKPLLEHIVERAKLNGFRKFVFAVNYLGEMIEEYFGDGSRWEVAIDYVREESPLGTAGALSLLARLPDSPIVVTNGDVLTDLHYGDLIDFHVRHESTATMAVRLYEWQHPFGVVRTKGIDIVGFEEKPVSRTHVNAGIYVLEPGVLDLLVSGEACDMPALFERVYESGYRAAVYPMHEPWLDVGKPDDLEKARRIRDREAP